MESQLSVLLLNAFDGGSHRAFAESLTRYSRHRWNTIGLPAIHWKWRMRAASLQLANELEIYSDSHHVPDVLMVTDMLDLAAFRGCLRDIAWLKIPVVLYFHENQFTYPNSPHARPDLHYGYTNLQSALIADQVWFNSQFHQTEFLNACREFMRRMPDGQNVHPVDQVLESSWVVPPGFDLPDNQRAKHCHTDGILRIAWASRWEFDKRPDLFLGLLNELRAIDFPFRLILLGPRSHRSSEVFETIQCAYSDRIDYAAENATREEYIEWLGRADVLVSTAEHEFFGIAACEGAWCGAIPLLPNRLAYPEFFPSEVLYDTLEHAIQMLLRLKDVEIRNRLRVKCQSAMSPWKAESTIARADRLLNDLVKKSEKESS